MKQLAKIIIIATVVGCIILYAMVINIIADMSIL